MNAPILYRLSHWEVPKVVGKKHGLATGPGLLTVEQWSDCVKINLFIAGRGQLYSVSREELSHSGWEVYAPLLTAGLKQVLDRDIVSN